MTTNNESEAIRLDVPSYDERRDALQDLVEEAVYEMNPTLTTYLTEIMRGLGIEPKELEHIDGQDPVQAALADPVQEHVVDALLEALVARTDR